MSNVLDLIRTAETNEPAPPLRAGEMPEALAAYEDEQDPAVRGPWAIDSLGSADWSLSRLAECEAEAAEIDRQAEAAIAKIRKRADELKAKAARGAAFFSYKLLAFAETHRATLLGSSKKKSRDFIHGRIAFRKKGGRLVVKDKDALLAWLATQPVEAGLYRMKLEPEMRAIQEQFKTAGEIPPGCDFEPEFEDVVIEANAPEAALVRGQ
jgi:phage host-nuclease inhibitor protein Gam